MDTEQSGDSAYSGLLGGIYSWGVRKEESPPSLVPSGTRDRPIYVCGSISGSWIYHPNIRLRYGQNISYSPDIDPGSPKVANPGYDDKGNSLVVRTA